MVLGNVKCRLEMQKILALDCLMNLKLLFIRLKCDIFGDNKFLLTDFSLVSSTIIRGLIISVKRISIIVEKILHVLVGAIKNMAILIRKGATRGVCHVLLSDWLQHYIQVVKGIHLIRECSS